MSLFVFNDILWLSLIAYSVSLFFGRLIFFIIQIFSSFQSILLVWISWIMSFLSPMDQFYQYKITVWHFSLKNEKHIFLYPMVMSRYHRIFFLPVFTRLCCISVLNFSFLEFQQLYIYQVYQDYKRPSYFQHAW